MPQSGISEAAVIRLYELTQRTSIQDTLQDGAEKTTTICSAGDYCQHQEGYLIKHPEKKHKCRICGLFFHGFICSDGKVQEPTGNMMRCLLCEDIM